MSSMRKGLADSGGPIKMVHTQRGCHAWNAVNRTVLRGGYGIFYSRYPIQYLLQTVAVNPPFAGLFSYSQPIQNGVPALTLNAPFSNAGASAGISPATVTYAGNKGTHLFRSINANSAYIDPVTKTIVRRFASTYGASTINFRQTNGNSFYGSMNSEIRRRASKNLLFQANWVWAKGLDDVGSTVQAALLDVQNLGRDRADSDYVRRHSLNANFVYDLPFHWRLSGIWRRTTGRYLTPTFTSSGGLSNSRPDVVYGVSPNLPADQRSPDRWLNAAAFAIVPATDPTTGLPRFGNAGRNTIIGPCLITVHPRMTQTRRQFMGSAVASLAAAQPARKWNLLIVTNDQHRADCLGCYGNPVVKTPALDQLAAEGARFENCFVHAPQCVPSRVSMHTGRYPHTHRVPSNAYVLPESEQTIAKILNAQGYRTACVGEMPFAPRSCTGGFQKVLANNSDYDKFLAARGLKFPRAEGRFQAAPVPWTEDQDETAFFSDHACKFISANRDAPFFLHINYRRPHHPFNPHAPYDKMYLGAKFPPSYKREGEMANKPPQQQAAIERASASICAP